MLAFFVGMKKKIYLGFWSHLSSERNFKFAFKINTIDFPLSFTAYKIYTAQILEGVEEEVALQWPGPAVPLTGGHETLSGNLH